MVLKISGLTALLLASIVPLSLHADPSKPTPSTPALIQEGRRLVESVGLCGDCHSPHGPDGSVDPKFTLTGSKLPFTPTVPMPWADVAPPLVGLHGFTDEEAVSFLQTGQRPSGIPVRPPMPAFRFNENEARAVVAYLRSLSPSYADAKE